MQVARNLVLVILRGYKSAISPWLPTSCRYVPTCSEYAMEAVERYGALRGTWMALARLMRCHPFAKSGFDPVVREQPHIHTILRFRARLKPARSRRLKATQRFLR